MTALIVVLGLGYVSSEFIPDLPNELAHDWYGLGTWWPLLAVVAFGIWAWWDKRNLHRRLAEVEKAIGKLQEELEKERKLLKLSCWACLNPSQAGDRALQYIRQLWSWARGDRTGDPPDIPDDLRDRLL